MNRKEEIAGGYGRSFRLEVEEGDVSDDAMGGVRMSVRGGEREAGVC